MSSNNWWLHKELQGLPGVSLDRECIPLILATHNGRSYRIYTPAPEEYIISVDIVDKVRDLGGNVISFASWSKPSAEARKHARTNGVDIFPHGALFERLGR